MSRFDDPVLYNPFGWRLADLADPATTAHRYRQLCDELVVWEAEEVAHGYHHLTVAHGDPVSLDASRQLSDFYDTVRTLAGEAEWVRVRGTAQHVTVTVAGVDADEHIASLETAAQLFNPGEWQIARSPYPDLDVWPR